MAHIDSGLGWSCDENYLVNDTETVIYNHAYSGYKCYKANSGAAILVTILFESDEKKYSIAGLLSTVEANCYTAYSDPIVALISRGVYDFRNLQWHLYLSQNGLEDKYGPANTYPEISFADGETILSNTLPLTVQKILEAANVMVDAKKIPTTNYVQHYVEAVLKQMPIITAEELSAMWNN